MQAICTVPVSPMRASPSHRSEMVSQVLFGELVELLEENDDWLRIRLLADGYEGWCQPAHFTEVQEPLKVQPPAYASDWINPVMVDEEFMWIPFGSRIDLVIQPQLKMEYFFRGNKLPAVELTGAIILEYARKYLHTPYLWGGRSVFGVDCSGLSQQVFRMAGISIPRDAYQQAEHGETIAKLNDAEAGDLAFFDNAERRITHVGILMNNRAIIHSSGMVRIDPIDDDGIINADTGKRTHNLKIIKRFL
jgi:gamma-D-glutamyl-L-lysine dipeptidyl-peptidase